ncbi:MAG: cyclic pyranopterin monophosphate synthase MoaC [Planctomycetota bacterium]
MFGAAASASGEPPDRSHGPRMIDVSDKEPTRRTARAEGYLQLGHGGLERLGDGSTPKGNVFEVARLAGITGAKLTPQIVPLCHPVALSLVEVLVEKAPPDRIRIESFVAAIDRTGVEMEALAAVMAAALAFYDMIKATERAASVEMIRLTEKAGGRSGHFVADPKPGTESGGSTS